MISSSMTGYQEIPRFISFTDDIINTLYLDEHLLGLFKNLNEITGPLNNKIRIFSPLNSLLKPQNQIKVMLQRTSNLKARKAAQRQCGSHLH